MSTFRHSWEIVLDGEPFKVTTRAGDYTTAERQIARAGQRLDQSPVSLQIRLAFVAFSRTYPEHPLARQWDPFLELFDDMVDLEDVEGIDDDLLDPTRRAGMGDSP